jgi:hypothetical protein
MFPDVLSRFLDSAPDWRKHFVPPARPTWRDLEALRFLESVDAVSRKALSSVCVSQHHAQLHAVGCL